MEHILRHIEQAMQSARQTSSMTDYLEAKRNEEKFAQAIESGIPGRDISRFWPDE
jgi:hypothetical protein